MRAFWSPVSALVIPELRGFATPGVLRRLLAMGGHVHLRYVGDRMWPAVRDGQRVSVDALVGPPQPGTIVLAVVDRVPDLLRVTAVEGEAVRLVGDADPSTPALVRRDDILGSAPGPRAATGAGMRNLRSLLRDLAEARRGRLEGAGDPAATVQSKYEEQAPFYFQSATAGLPSDLFDAVRRRTPAGGRVLVAGSGVGTEALLLAEAGLKVKGLDFAPTMVDLARRAAAQRGVAAEFEQQDLRTHDEPAKAWDAVLFTPEVYSFIPLRRVRVDLLRRIAAWLVPGGALYLAARERPGTYARIMLGLVWFFGGGPEFGDSRTRWPSAAGRLQRAFIHAFTPRALRSEIAEAGWRVEGRPADVWILAR